MAGTYSTSSSYATQRHFTNIVHVTFGNADVCYFYINGTQRFFQTITSNDQYIGVSDEPASPGTTYAITCVVNSVTVYTNTINTPADTTPNALTMLSPTGNPTLDPSGPITIACNPSDYDDPDMRYEFMIQDTVTWASYDSGEITPTSYVIPANTLTPNHTHQFSAKCRNSAFNYSSYTNYFYFSTSAGGSFIPNNNKLRNSPLTRM